MALQRDRETERPEHAGQVAPEAAGEALSTGIIDTHCHLDMKEFDEDRAAVISRAQEAGVEAIITVCSDRESIAACLRTAEEWPMVRTSVGLHPHDAVQFSPGTYDMLKDLAAREKVVAIGETGLDYHYDHSPRPVQRRVFEEHLRLARECGLPVIIHSREAGSDTLEIVRQSGVRRGVFHCFSGDREMAEHVIGMGFHISIAGPVTFRKSGDLKEVARVIPDGSLLVETDAPYLAPEPHRGKRNEPSFILHTVRQVAELRGISPRDAARITSLNARRLFGLGPLPEQGEIAYPIRDSLYLNITNRCTNTCSFCVKFHTDYVKGHRLSLVREPSEEEIRQQIGDPRRFREIVFCGYGEPLLRLETVKSVSQWIKAQGGRVRINTNGHANLIHGRDVLPELRGLVDSISVSLDAHDAETYERLCRPRFRNAYAEVIRFIEQARGVIPEVQITVVDIEGVDIARCRAIAEHLGVTLRVRQFNVVG